MRIALLSSARSIHTIRWAKALASRGHKVALISLECHKPETELSLPEVEQHYIKCSKGIFYGFGAKQLRKILKAFKPDILNTHYATGYGTLARKSGFAPLLLSVWGSDIYDFPYKSFFHKMIVRLNIKKADALASTSKAMAAQIRRVYKKDKKIFVTPFGVDCNLFRRMSKPQPDTLTIGTVKTLEPKYGIEYLIRAFAMLKARLEEENKMPQNGIRLNIYGKGSQREFLEQLCEQLCISEQTEFHGAIPNAQVPQAINGFDIFCVPSTLDSESFGVAAVEAMACETPCIVSDTDGLKEVCVNGKTGFIVPRSDAASLAEKLYILSQNDKLREKMGRAGRSHVLANYNWDDNVLTMEKAMAQTITIHKQK